MDTLFFTYTTNAQHPHPLLQEEHSILQKLFSPRAKEGHFLLHFGPVISSKQLADSLELHGRELALLHISGFAGQDPLFSIDAVPKLVDCPNLKLVFLNGCATQALVNALMEAGKYVIIATSSAVSDQMSAIFSRYFYQALFQQLSIREAFQLARAALDNKFPNAPAMYLNRSETAFKGEGAAPVWGVFYASKSEHLLDWKLPGRQEPQRALAETKDFVPNQKLIETLLLALAAFDHPKQLLARERKAEPVPFAHKRLEVLNTLEYPLAEPLRRLVVPVEGGEQGLDKLSEPRLHQWGKTYKNWMRFFISIQLSQLAEHILRGQTPDILVPELKEELEKHLSTKGDKDYYSIAQAMYYTLENLDAAYWYVDLGPIFEDAAVADACFFLEIIPELMTRGINIAQIKELCIKAEEAFTLLVSKLKFVSKDCRMASISNIRVEKKMGEVRFYHEAVMLNNMLGGLDQMELYLKEVLDQRSVLLINQVDWSYLNLSPLIIDETAFYTGHDVAKLYHFSYLTARGNLVYDEIRETLNPPLEAYRESNLASVFETFEAFYQAVFQKKLPAA